MLVFCVFLDNHIFCLTYWSFEHEVDYFYSIKNWLQI